MATVYYSIGSVTFIVVMVTVWLLYCKVASAIDAWNETRLHANGAIEDVKSAIEKMEATRSALQAVVIELDPAVKRISKASELISDATLSIKSTMDLVTQVVGLFKGGSTVGSVIETFFRRKP
ncbi:MAG: hypothetical protein P4L33_02760 [Capsulimonadaceae bacterium]|nr:hypothetical protein [Capsulimonadaceae bacterium]